MCCLGKIQSNFISGQQNYSLTTDDGYTRHTTLAACYQMAQSDLKIGFVLVKKTRWKRGRRTGLGTSTIHGGCFGWL